MGNSDNRGVSGQIDERELAIIMRGHIAVQLLAFAVEMGLFDQLSRRPGMTLDEIPGALGLSRWPARQFVRGLRALGLIYKSGDGFYNAALSEKHFVAGTQGYMGGEIRVSARLEYAAMGGLGVSIKENTNKALDLAFPGVQGTLYERMHKSSDRTLQELWLGGMASRSRRNIEKVLAAVDFSHAARVMDFCGGDGTNAIAIAQGNPQIRLTLVDLPSVCDFAAKNIAAAGLSDRISVWPCNILTDPLPPGGFDTVLYFHLFTVWSAERNRELLRKCAALLDSGGRIMIYNPSCVDDDSGPLEPAFLSLFLFAVATGEGGVYTGEEYAQALTDVGLGNITRKDWADNMHHELVTGTKP